MNKWMNVIVIIIIVIKTLSREKKKILFIYFLLQSKLRAILLLYGIYLFFHLLTFSPKTKKKWNQNK